jgi:RNA polymerase sigma factor (sigma-70 family)
MRRKRDCDRRLLERASSAPEAFAVFYRRHESAVVAFLGRLSGDAQLTVDLTAETFARAYGAREQFDPARGEARAWLLGIARNVLAASLERGRVESQARERLGMETLRVSEQTISGVEMIVIESGEAVVREWLDGLPASERDAVRRRVLDDASYAQIAAELSCSQAVVRQRVSRGLSRLRRTAMEER